MAQGPLLIAETPNAGALGHRYLVPAGVAFSELVAIHYVDQSRGSETKRGDDFLAVSSGVRQVKTGRENMPQTLVLAGINVGQLDETTIEQLFGRLKEVLTRLDPMAQAADWPLQTSGLVLQREEIATWQRECFAEPLPTRPLWEAAPEKHARDREPAAGGHAKWWAAAGALLLIPLVILASRGWWQHPEPGPGSVVSDGRDKEGKDRDDKKPPPPSAETWADRVMSFRTRTKSVSARDKIGPLLQQADELLHNQPAQNAQDSSTTLLSWRKQLKDRKEELEAEQQKRLKGNQDELAERWKEFTRACSEEPGTQQRALQKVADQLGSEGFWRYPAEMEEDQEKSRQQLLALAQKRNSVLARLADPKRALAQVPELIDLVGAYDKLPVGRPLVDRQTEKLRRLVAGEAERLVRAACARFGDDKDEVADWDRLRTADYEGLKAQIEAIKSHLARAGGWEEIAVEKWHEQIDRQREQVVLQTDHALYDKLKKAVTAFQRKLVTFDPGKSPSERQEAYQEFCKDFEKLQQKVSTYLTPPQGVVGNYRPVMEEEVRKKCRLAPAQPAKTPARNDTAGLALGLAGSWTAEKLTGAPTTYVKVVVEGFAPEWVDRLRVTLTVVSPGGSPKEERSYSLVLLNKEMAKRGTMVFAQNVPLTPLDLVTIRFGDGLAGPKSKPLVEETVLNLTADVRAIQVTRKIISGQIDCSIKTVSWPAEPLSEWRKPRP